MWARQVDRGRLKIPGQEKRVRATLQDSESVMALLGNRIPDRAICPFPLVWNSAVWLAAIGRGSRAPRIPHTVLAAVGDVGGDGVDPVEGIESTNGRAGAGIGRCRDLEQVVMPADAI
jgi:hypothetical protein